MPSDPEFRWKMRRLVRVRLRELVDGCVECRAQGSGYCTMHLEAAYDAALMTKGFLEKWGKDGSEIQKEVESWTYP
jgi:hypothetical protein